MKLKLPHSQKKKSARVPSVVSRNEYYENISAHLGIFQTVLYLTLFAFVILSFFRNTNLITYRNFYYFIKDLNASAESIDTFNADSLTYPTSDEQSFVLYRKGLAVAGNHAVTIFTANGRQNVSRNISYRNPTAIGTGKYLLVYEMGGTQYSLYNSFTQIFSAKTEFPIYGAAISESGMYALLTSSEQYSSVVSLYSSQFSLIGKYSKNGYVMDIAIGSKKDRLAILTATTDAGRFCSVASFYEPGKNTAVAEVEIPDQLAVACDFSSEGTLHILTESGILNLSATGKTLSAYDFAGQEIRKAQISSHGIAVSLKSSANSEKNNLIVFDKSGNMLYNKAVSVTVDEIAMYGNVLFLLTPHGIGRLDLQTGEILNHACITEQKRILAIDETEILLCSPQKAEYIQFI